MTNLRWNPHTMKAASHRRPVSDGSRAEPVVPAAVATLPSAPVSGANPSGSTATRPATPAATVGPAVPVVAAPAPARCVGTVTVGTVADNAGRIWRLGILDNSLEIRHDVSSAGRRRTTGQFWSDEIVPRQRRRSAPIVSVVA